MTRKSIGLLGMAIACATAISISASSCDNSPTTPGSKLPENGTKGPRVLDGPCGGSIGSQDCGIGQSAVSYDENGIMSVSKMSTSGGLRSTFAQPINYWLASIDARFPAAGNGSLSYSAQDNAGTTQARMDISQSDATTYTFRPTFTSNQGEGTPSYDVQILNASGTVVATQQQVSPSQATTMRIGTGTTSFPVTRIIWGVSQVRSQCMWTAQASSALQWTLPNGTVANGTQIRMIERNSNGFYVYIQSWIIIINGNLATYSQPSASGIQMSQGI